MKPYDKKFKEEAVKLSNDIGVNKCSRKNMYVLPCVDRLKK